MHKVKKQKPDAATRPKPKEIKFPPREAGKKIVLNIINANIPLPKIFNPDQWQEVTASKEIKTAQIPIDLRGISVVPDESCNAIWNAGALSYLQTHEVMPVIKECYRILHPGGFLMLSVSDLQRVGQVLAQGKPERELYRTPAGGIAAIDLLFGHRASLQAGRNDMQIHTGFTAGSLAQKAAAAGFGDVEVIREGWLLYLNARKVVASPPDKPSIRIREEDLNEMMRQRDRIEKDPEVMKITPGTAFEKPAK